MIAGYHWFTDWGRDTMISLEGLTLATGRHAEAGCILRTFAHYVRDGLIPNMFPEGENEGLYHTADATLWFFHALDRYLRATGDSARSRSCCRSCGSIVEHHLRGTRFGIGVDPARRPAAAGRTRVISSPGWTRRSDDWVVTPRRGKAVEINALWYNALRLLEGWLRAEQRRRDGCRPMPSTPTARASRSTSASGTRRRGYLYDVVDGEDGDDPALPAEPALRDFAAASGARRRAGSRCSTSSASALLTPVGLRSLAPDHPDYKPRYYGDLRARDAAYHQGTVWGWLIGPFVDAWLRVHPDDRDGARRLLDGLVAHLGEACVGSISEIFDAEAPYTPRGCIAQAWSVAELLRCLLRTGS